MARQEISVARKVWTVEEATEVEAIAAEETGLEEIAVEEIGLEATVVEATAQGATVEVEIELVESQQVATLARMALSASQGTPGRLATVVVLLDKSKLGKPLE